MLSLDLDIYLLSETHLMDNEVLGYKIIQFNRSYISRRAIKGSGGVAIALDNKLMGKHRVEKIYKGQRDGILGLKLNNIDTEILIGIIVNYLPPDT